MAAEKLDSIYIAQELQRILPNVEDFRRDAVLELLDEQLMQYQGELANATATERHVADRTARRYRNCRLALAVAGFLLGVAIAALVFLILNHKGDLI